MNDYITDYIASSKLANRIQQYWHDKGYRGVRVWVEKEEDRLWVIRSNLQLKV